MIIFKSQLYFDIKRPPVIDCPTIGGHFNSLCHTGFLCISESLFNYYQLARIPTDALIGALTLASPPFVHVWPISV